MSRIKLIGIRGRSNAGKSTVARMIRDELTNVCIFAVAEPMKVFVADVWDIPDDLLYGESQNRNVELKEFGVPARWIKVRENFDRKVTIFAMTLSSSVRCAPYEAKLRELFDALEADALKNGSFIPRTGLQAIGDGMREVDLDVWANYAGHKADRFRTMPDLRAIVIDDIRRVNESKMVLGRKGVVIGLDRVEVGGTSSSHGSEVEAGSDEVKELDTHDLVNDGDIETLRGKVAKLCDKIFGR